MFLNVALLNDKINASGLKRSFIADKLGITIHGLKNKTEGKTDFKTSEVAILCEILGITDLEEKEAIFFDIKVDGMSTN